MRVSLTRFHMPFIPYLWIMSTMSLSSCRTSKYAISGWYPASTRVSNEFCTMDAHPPQRSACSPNQSVSTSSLNVVLMRPALALPMAFATPSVLSQAPPVWSWWTATIEGVPKSCR